MEITHAQALETIANAFLRNVELDRKYRQENPSVTKKLSAPDPLLVIDAVVLPHVIYSIIARNHPTKGNEELLWRDTRSTISSDDMKRIAAICKEIGTHAREMHNEIMESYNRAKYEIIRQEMIDPQETIVTGWSKSRKTQRSLIQTILACLGIKN